MENPYQNINTYDCNMSNSLVVTDPKFLVDSFRAVITLWQFQQTSDLDLEMQSEIDKDFERGLISVQSLAILWNFMEKSERDSVTRIMVKLNQFIECP